MSEYKRYCIAFSLTSLIYLLHPYRKFWFPFTHKIKYLIEDSGDGTKLGILHYFP